MTYFFPNGDYGEFSNSGWSKVNIDWDEMTTFTRQNCIIDRLRKLEADNKRELLTRESM
jgi:hypothetical protein